MKHLVVMLLCVAVSSVFSIPASAATDKVEDKALTALDPSSAKPAPTDAKSSKPEESAVTEAAAKTAAVDPQALIPPPAVGKEAPAEPASANADYVAQMLSKKVPLAVLAQSGTQIPFLFRFSEIIEDVFATKSHIPMTTYLRMVNASIAFIQQEGSFLSYIGSTLEKYNMVLHQRLADYSKAHGVANESVVLQDMLLEEEANGVLARNEGEDPKDDRVSAGRTVLRVLWFHDFETAMLNNLLVNKTDSLHKVYSDAYDISLAPHHSWALRILFSAACSFSHDRQVVFRMETGMEEEWPETTNLLRSIITNFNGIQDELYNWYRVRNLTNLE